MTGPQQLQFSHRPNLPSGCPPAQPINGVTTGAAGCDPDPVDTEELVDTEAFIRDGFVTVRGAFGPAVAADCRRAIRAALRGRGADPATPSTWPPLAQFTDLDDDAFTAAASAPALTRAVDTLVGPGRWTPPIQAGHAVLVRFPSDGHANSGYHIEGSFDGPGGYWVNLRSRARGLLALFLFTDVGPDDAPTRLIVGSHRYIPELLAPYGENGVLSDTLAGQWRPSLLCRPMAHATGRAGDVFLCHPFLVHTATWPHRGTGPRMIAQPAVYAGGGFGLDGSDTAPVARAIVAGLSPHSQTAKNFGPVGSTCRSGGGAFV